MSQSVQKSARVMMILEHIIIDILVEKPDGYGIILEFFWNSSRFLRNFSRILLTSASLTKQINQAFSPFFKSEFCERAR